MADKKIRVLIVDDSALVRKVLGDGLARDPQIQVVGVAREPEAALKLLEQERPDVITLDVEMPGMDGVTFLRKYMQLYPTPTVMVSALTEHGKKVTLDALEAGAVDVVTKPRLNLVDGLPAMLGDLRERVKAAARAKIRVELLVEKKKREAENRRKLAAARWLPPSAEAPAEPQWEMTDRVIALGASAGGVAALGLILPMFPPTTPGIVMVQHMPAGFTASFAERLDHISQMRVKEAQDGDRVRPGLALLAPGGEQHMEVQRRGAEYRVRLSEGPRVTGHIPSVDVLFRTVAEQAGRNAVAALLTGMGDDGAVGLGKIRAAGGRTLAQDEATCVVWGMPGVAWERGAAEKLTPLDDIPRELLQWVKESSKP